MRFRDGLFLGLLIGVASALLYAPKKGKEVRSEVKDKLTNVPKHFFGLVESILDLTISVLEFTRESFQEQKEHLTSAVSSGINAAKEKTEELKRFASNISANN